MSETTAFFVGMFVGGGLVAIILLPALAIAANQQSSSRRRPRPGQPRWPWSQPDDNDPADWWKRGDQPPWNPEEDK